MKTILLLFIVSIATITITNLGCHKSNSNPDCGCNSPTIQTIDSVQQANGTLYFDSTHKEYYIVAGTPGLESQMRICDSSFSQLQSIVRTSPDHLNAYWVIYSGSLKNYCKSDTLFYLDFMYNIRLTSIKKY